MGLGYAVVAILSAAVAVFALQNNQPMPLRFLAWSIDSVPLAAAILVSLAIGFVLAAVPLSITAWRARSRARALQAQVERLETALSARDAAHLAPRAAAAVPTPRSA
jgi:uncharacterized integral membrane protein